MQVHEVAVARREALESARCHGELLVSMFAEDDAACSNFVKEVMLWWSIEIGWSFIIVVVIVLYCNGAL